MYLIVRNYACRMRHYVTSNFMHLSAKPNHHNAHFILWVFCRTKAAYAHFRDWSLPLFSILAPHKCPCECAALYYMLPLPRHSALRPFHKSRMCLFRTSLALTFLVFGKFYIAGVILNTILAQCPVAKVLQCHFEKVSRSVCK